MSMSSAPNQSSSSAKNLYPFRSMGPSSRLARLLSCRTPRFHSTSSPVSGGLTRCTVNTLVGSPLASLPSSRLHEHSSQSTTRGTSFLLLASSAGAFQNERTSDTWLRTSTATPSPVTLTRTSSLSIQKGSSKSMRLSSSSSRRVYGCSMHRAPSLSPRKSALHATPGSALGSATVMNVLSCALKVSTGCEGSSWPHSALSTTGGESSGWTSSSYGLGCTWSPLSWYPVGTYTATYTYLDVCAHV
mmetsp:Transcript_2115/g.7338  ORF Transcript_2115/g.7338 Transcript_2115/m.7338 type:complete len:245 (-) Transcript_2115:601-1335(-)